MAWTNGGPGSHIPERSKRAVRKRQNNRCIVLDASICIGTLDEFDHVVNVKALRIDRRHANDPALLQGLCVPCHKQKTAAEALAGRRKHLRKPLPHPGLKPEKEST